MTTKDYERLLNRWKKRLSLSEWKIKLVANCSSEDMTIPGCCGCTEWTESTKTALIQILNPEDYGDRIVPFDFEKTLVHELLHLKFSFWCQDEDSIPDRLMHQIINDLARAFVDGGG